MAFSASDAAFEGFRLTRAKFGTVALWGIVTILFNLAIASVMISLSGPAFMEMMRLSEGGATTDPTAMLPLFGELMRGYLVMIPLGLIFLSALSAAIYRASTDSPKRSFGYLRLGGDEFRLLVVMLVVGLIGFIFMFIVMMLLSILSGVIAVAAGMGQGQGMVWVMVCVLYLGLFLIGLAFYVKFSFAGPMTFLQGRIRIFGSWGATSGRFWSLYGCYLLACVLGFVVALLGGAIGFAILVGLGGSLQSLMRPDMTSFAAYFTPGMIGYLIVGGIFNAMFYSIVMAPAMAAYRAIHGGAPADASSAFD